MFQVCAEMCLLIISVLQEFLQFFLALWNVQEVMSVNTLASQ